MAHEYQYLFDEWAASGTKTMPSVALKTTGFVAGMKPPASVFNYQWDKIGRAITELQENALTEDPSGGIWKKLSPVALSGSYNDLYNLPPLKAVATSGSYTDLINAPAFGTYVGDGTGTTAAKITTNDFYKYSFDSPRSISLPYEPSVLFLFNRSSVNVIAQGDHYISYFGSNESVWLHGLSGSVLQVVAGIPNTNLGGLIEVSFENVNEFFGNTSGVIYHWIALP